MINVPNDSLRYAGFGRRLVALLLDMLIVLPLSAVVFYFAEAHVVFRISDYVAAIFFGLFYQVYLVRRLGGTPGKLIAKLRIRKETGKAISYREAFFRYGPQFLFNLLGSVALIEASLRLSNSEYQLLSFHERNHRALALVPSWDRPLWVANLIWIVVETIVFFANRKRRALHDFIAGTVVVNLAPEKPSTQRAFQPFADY